MLTKGLSRIFHPLLYGQTRGNPAINTITLNNPSFSLPLSKDHQIITIDEQTLEHCDLQIEIDRLLQTAAYLLVNHSDKDILHNFPILQSCSSELLHKLKNTKITSIDQIKDLLKIDLHCHPGGCLPIDDIVRIAEQVRIKELKGVEPLSLKEGKSYIEQARRNPGYFKNLTYKTKISILTSFIGNEHLLEQLWFEPLDYNVHGYIKPDTKFDMYEQLGDLQGSSLLQTKTAICLAVQTLLQQSKNDACIGLEIRCSPQNYTKEGLTYNEVLFEILKEIHAGETQNAESIWEAVYELNADRIGHGLSLYQNKPLLAKFREKAIGIELCPSSNFQIVGFNDYHLGITNKQTYLLREYLDQKLKVTLNTDNRGISRTTVSNEFLKASHMTESGLSLLDALQLCKNSIDVSFFDHSTKEHLFLSSQEKVRHWLETI